MNGRAKETPTSCLPLLRGTGTSALWGRAVDESGDLGHGHANTSLADLHRADLSRVDQTPQLRPADREHLARLLDRDHSRAVR